MSLSTARESDNAHRTMLDKLQARINYTSESDLTKVRLCQVVLVDSNLCLRLFGLFRLLGCILTHVEVHWRYSRKSLPFVDQLFLRLFVNRLGRFVAELGVLGGKIRSACHFGMRRIASKAAAMAGRASKGAFWPLCLIEDEIMSDYCRREQRSKDAQSPFLRKSLMY